MSQDYASSMAHYLSTIATCDPFTVSLYNSKRIVASTPTAATNNNYVNNTRDNNTALVPINRTGPLVKTRPRTSNNNNNNSKARTKIDHCVLCKSNKEPEGFYNSHTLKDGQGRVTCPVLMAYTCPTCSKQGEHTVSYCPLNKNRRARSFGNVIYKKPEPIGYNRDKRSLNNSVSSSLTNSTLNSSITNGSHNSSMASDSYFGGGRGGHYSSTAILPIGRPRPETFYCVLCKGMQQPWSFYITHTLRDDENRAACPILKDLLRLDEARN